MNHMNLKPTTQAAFVLLIVFLLDLIVPLGIAIGILYLAGFLLVCSQNKKTIIIFALIASILTIIKFILFFSTETSYLAYVNRCITIGIIWIIAILALKHRTIIEQMSSERETYIKELEEMLFITSHEVRKPVSSCLGLMNLVESDKSLSQEELWKIIEHLKSSALELGSFTAKLTTFIYEMGKRTKNKP